MKNIFDIGGGYLNFYKILHRPKEATLHAQKTLFKRGINPLT